MVGNENLAFKMDSLEKGGNASFDGATEVRVDDLTNGVSPGQEKKHEVKVADNVDVFSRFLVAVRSGIYRFVVDHKKFFKYLLYVTLNILLFGYLVAAIVIHKSIGHNTDYWNGLGLLIVLYSLSYGGIFYFFIVKPYVGRLFDKYVSNIGRRLWTKKFFRWICYLIPIGAFSAYLILDTVGNRQRLVSFCGIIVFYLFGFIFSKSPGHIQWRPVFTGLALQFVFGLLTLKWDVGKNILAFMGEKISTFLQFTQNGTSFVYGPLVEGTIPKEYGPIFAFSVLPVIFFFSFVVSMLSYCGILQWFVLKLAWLVQVVMRTTVCESVNAVASIFLGQTESILLIKSNMRDLTKSELHAIMCAGFATVSGSVLAAYISFGVSPSHLITASVMSAPAALSFSKLFYPETEESKTTIENIVLDREEGTNLLDAACKGAMAAISIIAGMIANIVAFLAFLAFFDAVLHWCGLLVNFEELSCQYIITKVFFPISFLMGVDSDSLEDVSLLVGTKTVVNEFKAYMMLGEVKDKFTARTEAVVTYALCGFSNFGSIGILIAAISSLEPKQRSNSTEVAVRAFIASNIVCFITACVAGTLIDV